MGIPDLNTVVGNPIDENGEFLFLVGCPVLGPTHGFREDGEEEVRSRNQEARVGKCCEYGRIQIPNQSTKYQINHSLGNTGKLRKLNHVTQCSATE